MRRLPGTECTIPRIAIVFEYGTLNGGEHSMLAVLDRLSASDLEFVALAPSQGRLAEALKTRGIAHLPLQLRDETGKRLLREHASENLRKAIQRASPDLVHANSLSMGRLTGGICGELSMPCIAHLRDMLKLTKTAVADLNRNRLLIAVSQATKKYHVGQGLDSEKVHVFYNGIDCERFRPRNATGSLKRELQLSDEAFLIAAIGQIGLRKGQDVLAEAAVFVADQLPNAHYLIIGERHSTKLESIEFERNVIRRFARAGLEHRLHRLGYRNDIERLLNELDLLVHPAKQEPLGRVLLEAAAAGVPIIATRVGGTEEILRDEETAILIPPDDPQALAEAIVELHGNPEKRQRFALQARRQVEENFHIDRAASALAAVWNELV